MGELVTDSAIHGSGPDDMMSADTIENFAMRSGFDANPNDAIALDDAEDVPRMGETAADWRGQAGIACGRGARLGERGRGVRRGAVRDCLESAAGARKIVEVIGWPVQTIIERRKKVAMRKKRAQRPRMRLKHPLAKRTLGMRLKILEAIPRTRNPGQDMPILEEFLKMEAVKYSSLRVDNRLAESGLKRDFLQKLLLKRYVSGGRLHNHRHVHISAHGDGDALVLGLPERKAYLTAEDLCEYCDRHNSYLQGRLITLSACGSLLGGFAETLLDKCRTSAVIRPLSTVRFQESAMFFMLFYFILSQRTISFECAEDTVEFGMMSGRSKRRLNRYSNSAR